MPEGRPQLLMPALCYEKRQISIMSSRKTRLLETKQPSLQTLTAERSMAGILVLFSNIRSLSSDAHDDATPFLKQTHHDASAREALDLHPEFLIRARLGRVVDNNDAPRVQNHTSRPWGRETLDMIRALGTHPYLSLGGGFFDAGEARGSWASFEENQERPSVSTVHASTLPPSSS